MKRAWHIKCLASLSIVFSIVLSLVQVNAFAVTQFELDEIQKEKEELIDLVRTLTPEEVEKVIDRARQLLVPQ